jgi:hypothetical protein
MVLPDSYAPSRPPKMIAGFAEGRDQRGISTAGRVVEGIVGNVGKGRW